VYSPTHEVDVKRPEGKRAIVSFEAKNTVPATDFRLFFDVSKEKLGASVISFRPDQSEDGYYLLMASPEIKSESEERPAKTVIFVVDRSGSMSGKKIDQAKEALRSVLNNLSKGDLFNVVAYDSSVESFRPELQRYEDETRNAALGFVDSIYAGGSTNIDGALSTAMKMIQDASRPNFVIFLTDGRPTAGETNESKIAVNAKQYNELNTRLISFGVGYDVNSRLLDRLSDDNFGSSEFVRPDEDIEEHVSRIFNRISSPVMTNVVVEFELEKSHVEEGPPVNRVYPGQVHDLFAGEQLVMVGRYRKPGNAKVFVSGKVGDRKDKFDFPAELVDSSKDQSYAFVEKLWAMRRIGEIINEMDLHGENEELLKELVALSTKHGILTPYTSFLADETSSVRELADARRTVDRARQLVQNLNTADGISGFAQRGEKKALREANQVPLAGRGGVELPKPDAAAGYSGKLAGGGVKFRDIETDKEVFADSVQMVGNETLYKRGNLWIAANAQDVDLERDKDKIKVVKRFSDEYFKLIAANTAAENAVLARQQPGEDLVINLRGQIYHVQ
jgi:Ca-activated chloride channel family protein